MIIIGAYPKAFDISTDSITPIQRLHKTLSDLPLHEIGIHLLPFYPNSGDSGFAPDDWHSVQDEYGSWEDIELLAKSCRLIVDGIYNHVGWKHPITQLFLSNPYNYKELVYAFPANENMQEWAPLSPRGGSVLRKYIIQNEPWLVWQTFSKYAIDINIGHPYIQEAISQHIYKMKRLGAWGIRLDGPAYYGKDLYVGKPRHSKKSYLYARMIADKILESGMQVTAQLDCDSQGIRYYPRDIGYKIPTVDYSYSALLLYSFLYEDMEAIATHLCKTWSYFVIRALRTHDGILMKSENLSPRIKQKLVAKMKTFGINPRIIDGVPYEFNNSFPYLMRLGTKGNFSDIWTKIEIALAFTSALPGWTYIYLPLLFAYIPEDYHEFEEDDPRKLNRKPIPQNIYDSIVVHNKARLVNLINNLLRIKGTNDDFWWNEICNVTVIDNVAILVERRRKGIVFVGNFSSNTTIDIPRLVEKKKSIWQVRIEKNTILPYGFGFWSNE